MTSKNRTLALRIALTVSAMEFFGPTLRDAGASHALNPDWVGHARVHLVWLLGFMGLSGFVNLYFIWFRRPIVESLRLSVIWRACNLGGFWIAIVLNPAYHGAITVPGIHMHIFGIDENVFAFSVLSVILAAACLGLRGHHAEEDNDAGGAHHASA